MEQLIVINRLHTKGCAKSAPAALSENFISWKTCLREISIGFVTNLDDFDLRDLGSRGSVFNGEEAYIFLSEVICGLHSPVVGETEVMGQFKELIEASLNSEKYNNQFQKLFYSLLADAKLVRQSCLRDLGSRSYGSLLRRHLKGVETLNILGAGKLVKEILPWISPKVKGINVFCRRKVQGEDLLPLIPGARIHSFPSQIKNITIPLKDAVIIAAPLPTEEVNALLKLSEENLSRVIDLRDGGSETLSLNVPVICLNDLFSAIEAARGEAKLRVDKARVLIRELTQKRFRTVEFRPFGWEDLCG